MNIIMNIVMKLWEVLQESNIKYTLIKNFFNLYNL